MNITKVPAHEQLVKKVIEYLKDEGYEDSEIHTEYYLKFPKRLYLIDVAVIQPNKKNKFQVAVEVGELDGKYRLNILETHFERVVWVPYGEVLMITNPVNNELEKEVEQLKMTIIDLDAQRSLLEERLLEIIEKTSVSVSVDDEEFYRRFRGIVTDEQIISTLVRRWRERP